MNTYSLTVVDRTLSFLLADAERKTAAAPERINKVITARIIHNKIKTFITEHYAHLQHMSKETVDQEGREDIWFIYDTWQHKNDKDVYLDIQTKVTNWSVVAHDMRDKVENIYTTLICKGQFHPLSGKFRTIKTNQHDAITYDEKGVYCDLPIKSGTNSIHPFLIDAIPITSHIINNDDGGDESPIKLLNFIKMAALEWTAITAFLIADVKWNFHDIVFKTRHLEDGKTRIPYTVDVKAKRDYSFLKHGAYSPKEILFKIQPDNSIENANIQITFIDPTKGTLETTPTTLTKLNDTIQSILTDRA
jgi:hypothetical protein